MYKDLYKKANDSIPTDDVKRRVMSRLEKPVITKVSPRKRVTEIALLAACMVFTFAAVGVYNNFEKEQDDKILRINTPQMTHVSEEEPDISEAGAMAVLTEPAKETAKPSVSPQKQKTAPTKKPAEPSEKVQEPAAESVAPATPEAKTGLIVNEIKEAADGEPAPASLMIDRSIGRIEEVSLSEYYDYIGKNIESTAKLPEGFTLITDGSAMLEVTDSGEYKNDSWCFTYENETKSVEIITSKKTETISEQIADENYEKSIVSGCEAVVMKENDIYRAYMIPKDVGYTVTSFGLDETELEDLLISLAE